MNYNTGVRVLSIGGISLLISMLLIAPAILASHYYVHEYAGHMAFGYMVNILNGKMPTYNTGVWEKIWYVPIPRQTVPNGIVYDSPITRLAGPVVWIIWSIVLSFVFYSLFVKKYKLNLGKTILALFIVSMSLQTIIGDMLFGTDGWIAGREDSIVNYTDYPLASTYVNYSGAINLLLITFMMTYFLYPLIKLHVEKKLIKCL